MYKLLLIAALFGVGYLAYRKLTQPALKNQTKSDDLEYMARTLYGEASGEGYAGQQAVANVIMNRLKNPLRFGVSVTDVCLKPKQFSCWNGGDANYTRIINATPSQLNTAYSIAQKAINGTLPDITGGANHYHATSVKPYWAASMQKTVTIGNHVFYKG